MPFQEAGGRMACTNVRNHSQSGIMAPELYARLAAVLLGLLHLTVAFATPGLVLVGVQCLVPGQ